MTAKAPTRVKTGPTQAEQAAAKYLAGDLDGLKHLVRLCQVATSGLWLPGTWRERETVKQEWILAWLLDSFGAYFADPPVNAERPFRYLPRQCRQRFIDEMRRLRRAKAAPAHSLDAPLDGRAGTGTFAEFLYQPAGIAGTSHSGRTPGADLDRAAKLADAIPLPGSLQGVLQEQLAAFLGGSSKTVLDGRIASRLGVSPRTARTLRTKLRIELTRMLNEREPDVLGLFEYLVSADRPTVGTDVSKRCRARHIHYEGAGRMTIPGLGAQFESKIEAQKELPTLGATFTV